MKEIEMRAQAMYDLRDEIEFCNGRDLAGFLHEQTGEALPRGSAQIDPDEARKFIASSLDAMKWNSPSLF